MNIELSIIIVSWNTKDLLKKCLESIYRETKDIVFEIFVVDNASSDGTIEMLKENFKNIRLIANKKNLGFARANNQAIKETASDFVILLNPDTELFDNSLKKMIDFMKARPNIGVLGPKLLNSDKTRQPSTRRFPNFLNQLIILFKLHHLFPNLKSYKKYLMRDFDGQREMGVNQVMGAAFMIRRKLIEQVGMLDEDYFIWFEEVDYCRRAKKADWEVYYNPDARIIHYGGESFAQLGAIKKQWMYFTSMIKYFKNNGWQIF